tara:strand:- start:32 stop:841 length:810 start_codon:yes stop_codon:yes gene_type:complete
MIKTHETFNIPALLAESPSSNVSHHYNFLSTKDIVDEMGTHGWLPRKAFYMASRDNIEGEEQTSRDPLHAKHCIRFAHKSINKDTSPDEFPEIVMYNSHNGTSSLYLSSGIFRMVCSNGLIVKSEDYGEYRVKHRGPSANMDYVSHLIGELAEANTAVMDEVDKLGSLDMDHDVKREYYRGAMKLRFPQFMPGEEWIFDMHKRTEDLGNDLWRSFNRCQEYLENGGFPVTHTAGKAPRMSREITNINRVKDLNTELWSYTDAFYAHANA